MAYKCIKKEWSTDFDGYIHKFICDSEADIADLPKCSPGSVAIVAIEGRPKYGINASGDWTRLDGDAELGGAGDCDWEIMKNKPFYDETKDYGSTITWDGNTEGLLEVVTINETFEEGYQYAGLYLVSEAIPNVENITLSIGTIDTEGSYTYDIQLEEVEENVLCDPEGYVFITLEDNVNFDDFDFPKKGVWFRKLKESVDGVFFNVYVSSVTLHEGSFVENKFKKLDPKFIPNTIARNTVFYIKNVDADEYLYTDSDYTVKATMGDVMTAMDSGQIWCFNDDEGFYYQVVFVIDNDGCATVVVATTTTDSSKLSYRYLYTAEYSGTPA